MISTDTPSSKPVTLVTIGIPCRNTEQWIAKAIDSALDQQTENLEVEVIVVNDASTDQSRKVAESFGERVRLFDGIGKGAPVARNKILTEARGEWIQYLDADDYLLPKKIETQLSEAVPGKIPYAPVIEEKWANGTATNRRIPAIDTTLSIESQWILWQMPQTSGVLWKRSVLEQLGGWKESQPCCQEHELYLRAIRAGVEFCYTPTALAVYRLWSEETLCRRNPAQVISIRAGLINEMLAWLESTSRKQPEHVEAARQILFESARTLAVQNFEEALAFHRQWKQRGLIKPIGPAAPLRYRLIYSILGFAFAERIAKIGR